MIFFRRLQQSRTTYQTGLWAEALCCLSLRLRFYRVLATRYRSPLGEIDVVALRGNSLVVIEVKARDNHDAALSAVSRRQRQRLERAANHFLAHHAGYQKCNLRFDVMTVGRMGWPRHVVDAWRPGFDG